MLIDIVFAIILILAVMQGYQRGLIVGLFSLVAVIIGIAAAMKLSAVVASRIGNAVNVSEEWLPLISFIIVFIVIVLLIRLGAKAIERTVEVVMLGWLNKLAGVILFVAIYTIVFSVLLFYAEKMQLLQQDLISRSATYPYVQPWGPKVIDGFGSIIPVFKDMFEELEGFFENLSKKV